jgi:transcriptional regulator with XRE-family HTH domain
VSGLKRRVSKNITRYRELAKISKKQFAKNYGTDNRFVHYLEDHQDPPNLTLDVIERVAKALGCTPAQLLAGRGESDIEILPPVADAVRNTLEEIAKQATSAAAIIDNTRPSRK